MYKMEFNWNALRIHSWFSFFNLQKSWEKIPHVYYIWATEMLNSKKWWSNSIEWGWEGLSWTKSEKECCYSWFEIQLRSSLLNARDHIWTEQNSFQTEIGMCQQLGKVPLAPKIEVGDQISNPERNYQNWLFIPKIFWGIFQT